MSLTPSRRGPRVVSLLPSATEIVCTLGAGESLVGRSHECDFPNGLESLPVLTRPGLDINASSRRIDEEVKGLVETGLSVFDVDAERLRALAPDVILTQTQCEVCAVTPDDLQAALAEWTGSTPEIVSLEPCSLDEVWASVETVADAIGLSRQGAEKADALREHCEQLSTTIRTPVPTVATVEWIAPLMAAGNWVPELIERAGAKSLFGEAGAHSSWLEPETLLSSDPDWVVVMPCGFTPVADSGRGPPTFETAPLVTRASASRWPRGGCRWTQFLQSSRAPAGGFARDSVGDSRFEPALRAP